MTDNATTSAEEQQTDGQTTASASTRRQRQGEKARALLAQLAEWHPQLFGDAPAPLKRGIFQDLAAAHPDVPHTALRAALRLHTSSTRYLKALADGGARLGLDGQESEQVAPEHIWQALAALFARRCRRADANLEEQRRWLRRRALRAWQGSGLTPAAWEHAALTQGSQGDDADAALQDAMQDAAAYAARSEALLRAFEGQQQSESAFAADWGLHPLEAARQLALARRLRAGAASA